jgi:hypothetical protein
LGSDRPWRQIEAKPKSTSGLEQLAGSIRMNSFA